jgi:hypothetical protein
MPEINEIFRRPIQTHARDEVSVWALIDEKQFRDHGVNRWRTKAAMLVAYGILARDGFLRTELFEYTTDPR